MSLRSKTTRVISDRFTENAIMLAINSDWSAIKYPCSDQKNEFAKIIESEYKEISFELCVTYVLYNCGKS